MKIGILGSGVVAQTLGAGFRKHGHDVMLGTRTPEKLDDWKGQTPGGQVGSFDEAAKFGDTIVLAVKGSVAAEVVRAAGPANLDGKIVIDATNPIADRPPTKGVLAFFTNFDESLMERLQNQFAGVRFVKAFNYVGSARMVNPSFAAGRPSMFICGNDDSAKSTVAKILDDFGWDVEDMGTAEAARAIEPLCMLWCIPGFLRNEWGHAFKLVR
jgi:predicted dinucleotide-binding enzyme